MAYIYPTSNYRGLRHDDQRNTVSNVLDRLWPGVPVRVLDGASTQQTEPARWLAEHRGDHTAADAREHGITIWDGATLSGQAEFADTLRINPRPIGLSSRDWVDDTLNVADPLHARDSDGTATPIMVPGYRDRGEQQIGEFKYRTIALFAVMRQLTALFTWDDGAALMNVLRPIAQHVTDESYFADLEARRTEESQRQFVELAQAQSGEIIERLENQISEFEQSYMNAQENMTQAQRNLETSQRQIEAAFAQAENPVTADDLEVQWDAIQRHTNVESITFNGRSLIVNTGELYLPHPVDPDAHEPACLGEYRLVFDFRRDTVRINNMTNKQGEHDHPHVNNGRFCAGSWQPSVDRLLMERQFAAAVAFVIDTLGHCNPNDTWGRTYRYWF